MKRILLVLLTVLMLAGLCCVSIAAADTITHAVGTHGESKTVADGVEEIPTTGASSSGDVVLTVGKTNSRYAVDVTFPDAMTIEAASMTWNVNTLQYEMDGETVGNKTFDFKIGVTNYSDLPVVAAPTAELTTEGTNAGLSFVLPADPTPLMAVTDTQNTDGGAVAKNIIVTLKSDTWTESVNKLIATGAKKVTVGTITITITKPTP